ncbi:uncharacterized protein MELLADRAFT_95830 [Melampsora larici-populina 98AG31]|nr:uncharacterized protein MELLADRAFT_95830 [Melampsora larici-populina 98AG31]EGG09386.1 hypothetical protein MELLADRAFT_95830 [Melampsora larici-populina 98AG31]
MNHVSFSINSNTYPLLFLLIRKSTCRIMIVLSLPNSYICIFLFDFDSVCNRSLKSISNLINLFVFRLCFDDHVWKNTSIRMINRSISKD